MINTLGDCVTFLNGDRGKNYPKQVDFVNGEVPFITASDLSNNTLSNKSNYQKKISKDAYEKLRAGKVVKKDILLCLRGSLGKLGVVGDDMTAAIASSLVILRPNDQINSGFLLQWLKSPEFQQILASYDNGSVQGNLSVKNISTIALPNFSPSDQKAIAHILGALDDKIELNQEMNKTLEQIAKVIFKSWFVNFDPVRAKTEGRPTSLPPEISDLFPDELVDSEIGEIPKGWGTKSAENLFDITIGRTPPRKETHWFTKSEKDVPWVSISDMGDCGTFISKTKESLTHEAVNKHRMHILPVGSVLVSFKLTVGRVSIAAKEVTTNEAIAHFPPSGDFPNPNFVYFYLKGFRYDALGSTSSIANAVNSKMIKTIPFLIAPSELIAKFEKIVAPIMEKIRLTSDEILLLSDLRDALLPKLISGELRVPDAEKFLEEADI